MHHHTEIRKPRLFRGLPWLLSVALLAGCGGDSGSVYSDGKLLAASPTPPPGASLPPTQPAGWDDAVRVAALIDRNPRPDIVEVEMEAVTSAWQYVPGSPTQGYSYNGQVPGPTIEAVLGQTLVVNFTNRLPETTTIHWHGLDLPALEDGSSISQLPIQPGETYTYRFKLQNSGTFWYHPHIATHEQIEKGLHGMLIVRDREEDLALSLPPSELALMLDDVLLDAGNQLEPPFPSDPAENAETQLNGREGNVLLVNGKVMPTVHVRSGVPVRMRLVDCTNARFMRISLHGHPLTILGTDGGLATRSRTAHPIHLIEDGAGHGGHGSMPPPPGAMLISDPDPSAGVLLTPGERADIVFTPIGGPGDVIHMQWHDFPRGRHHVADTPAGLSVGHAHDDGKRSPVGLMSFVFTDDSDPSASAYQAPDWLRSIDALDISAAETLPVTFGHSMPDAAGDVNFFAQVVGGMPTPFPLLGPDDGLHAFVGETYIWEVKNLTGGDHPFHTHGFSFQVLEVRSIDDVVAANNSVWRPAALEWKDTLRIPARPGAAGTSRTIARCAVVFDDRGREGQVEAYGKEPELGRSGGWLVHCHLLEHAARGMLTFLNLRYR